MAKADQPEYGPAEGAQTEDEAQHFHYLNPAKQGSLAILDGDLPTDGRKVILAR